MASGDAAPGVSRRFRQESHVPTYALDQTTGQSGEATHLGASAPTSTPSGSPYSRSVVFASSATLPLLTQRLLCCIDRLNLHPISDLRFRYSTEISFAPRIANPSARTVIVNSSSSTPCATYARMSRVRCHPAAGGRSVSSRALCAHALHVRDCWSRMSCVP